MRILNFALWSVNTLLCVAGAIKQYGDAPVVSIGLGLLAVVCLAFAAENFKHIFG